RAFSALFARPSHPLRASASRRLPWRLDPNPANELFEVRPFAAHQNPNPVYPRRDPCDQQSAGAAQRVRRDHVEPGAVAAPPLPLTTAARWLSNSLPDAPQIAN